jgi:chromosome segregation ATPase
MTRNQHQLERREWQSPSRQDLNVRHEYSGFAYHGAMPEDTPRLPYQGGANSLDNSTHHTTSSTRSAFIPPQSPMHAPQPIRSILLPSPSSLNFPSTSNFSSLSPPSGIHETSAQSAHLQDLQHQISVKTLAFQTLQREYDSLLQRLERQRTKCAILEKKLEVSDVEINSLTDEKEKMQVQIVVLEDQVEGLQQSRDEARRQLIDNGAQWQKIVGMANKLEGKGAEEKKKWDAERCKLQQRIELLEEIVATGTEESSRETESFTVAGPSSTSVPPFPSTSDMAHAATINVLRAEVGHLRTRTQSLETALHTMRRESASIQAAARQIVESGGILEKVSLSTMGTGG